VTGQPRQRQEVRAPHPDWWHPQWLSRPPTVEEARWIDAWMRQHNGYEGEVLGQWKVIDDMLRAAGYEAQAGGGPENDDLVRDLIARAERTDRIAAEHAKWVGAGGLTDGSCRECGEPWPCPSYDWARRDSDRDPALSCWHRADEASDEPEAP
jgi:hypothetical protein